MEEILKKFQSRSLKTKIFVINSFKSLENEQEIDKYSLL